MGWNDVDGAIGMEASHHLRLDIMEDDSSQLCTGTPFPFPLSLSASLAFPNQLSFIRIFLHIAEAQVRSQAYRCRPCK